MATIVDRPHPFPPVTAHHARNPGYVPPPHHTRSAQASRRARHGGHRRRYVARDLGLALLTLVIAAGVVYALLENADPAVKTQVLAIVEPAWDAVSAKVGGLSLPWAG